MAAKAKKTVSDNVVLAQSRNRSVEHSLSRTMRRLTDQEQHLHARHQREILQWRDFRRQSIRTSGTWATSFEEEFSNEDWSGASEENLDMLRDFKRDPENSSGGSPINSPRLNIQPGSSVGISGETGLMKFPKPWAYTYSKTSYNSLYKESIQLTEGQKKRLNFRRASESVRSASPDHMKMFRSRSSIGDARQDMVSGSRTPLTGRSTPRIPQRSRSSCHRLSVSAFVDKTRPKTSVGLVRGAKNQQQEVSEKKTNGHASHYEPDDNQSAEKSDTGLSSASAQQTNRGDTVDDGGDVVDVLARMKGNTSHSVTGESPQSNSAPSDLKSPSFVAETTDNEADTHTKLNLSVLENSSETDKSGAPPLILETDENTYLQEQELTESVDKADISNHTDKTYTSQLTSPTLSNIPERLVKEKKVHIQLTASDKKVHSRSIEIDSKSRRAQYQSCAKDKPIVSSTDSAKRDENMPPPTKKAAEPAKAWSSPPTPRHPQIRTDSRETNRLKSIGCDQNTRRCSDAGVLRQRSDMTSNLSRTERRSSGSLSRRYSLIDMSGPSSFLKIADQLEALREFSQQKMIPIDDDKEDWSEDDVSGSPNEVNTSVTPLSGKEGQGRNTVFRYTQAKSFRGNEKAPKNGRVFEKQNSPSPERISVSHISNSSTNTEERSPETKKPTLNKTSEEISQRISNYNNSADKTQDIVKTPENGVPKNKSPAITIFKGFKLHNYIRPQDRYREDTFAHLRQEKAMLRPSSQNLVRPKTENGLKPAVVFSKTSRRKVLQELVHRHNQPVRTADSGVVPPQLRSRIDEFLKTIEPYCPKPDLLLD